MFALLILGFPTATWLLEDKEDIHKKISEYEPESFLSGEYQTDLEKYYREHFAFRKAMSAAYTKFKISVIDKLVVNDIIITERVLLPFHENLTVNEEKVKRQANQMGEKLYTLNNTVMDSGGIFFYVGVPEQGSMLRELYPSFLNNNASYLDTVEKAFYESLDGYGVAYINMRDVYRSETDYFRFYSATDHHFNMLGAYECYKAIIKKAQDCGFGVPLLTNDDLSLIELPNKYYGSRSRSLNKMYSVSDKLSYYELKNPVDYVRYDSDVPVDRIIFAPENAEEDITYNIYMGGDNAKTYIDTSREELPTILMFGDSFTNPVETLLYASFGKSIFIDLRHYKESTIYECIEKYKPDIVICLRDDTQYLSFDGNGGF